MSVSAVRNADPTSGIRHKTYATILPKPHESAVAQVVKDCIHVIHAERHVNAYRRSGAILQYDRDHGARATRELIC